MGRLWEANSHVTIRRRIQNRIRHRDYQFASVQNNTKWPCHAVSPTLAHSALGPGVPDPPKESVETPKSTSRHGLAAGALVLAQAVIGGLHHEYSLALIAVRP
jgi:hypothetical protein